MRKLILSVSVAVLVFVLAAPVRAVECTGIALNNGCLFTVTGGDTSDPNDGYAVTNEGGVPIWDFFRQQPVSAVGYPISQRWVDGPFTLQAFQKVILQWSSTDRKMNWFNTLDELNKSFPSANIGNVPRHQNLPGDAGQSFEVVKQNHLDILNANPKIKAAFLGESDWLNLYGLPISYEARTVSGNPQGLQLLRAQRVVFEVWNVDAPGTARGVVGRQNVPDTIKKLTNVIIPDTAELPITQAQATSSGGTAVATAVPVATVNPTPTPIPPTPVPTPAPSATIPGPRVLAQGLQGYGIQGEFRRADDATLANLITEAGLGWVKQQVPWQDVENQPGIYNWVDVDRFVNTMRGKNLNVLLSVVKAPDFYKAEESKKGTTHGRPADATKFREFMQVLAARYKGRVQAYELWNEENLSLEWGTFSNASYGQFVDLVKNGYLGVKASDPEAIIILGAPTPTGVFDNNIGIDDAVYLQRVFDYNGGEVFQYFEALGVHPNGGANAPDDSQANPAHSTATCGGGWSNHPSFFFDRYKELYNLMAARGHGSKTVWFTEFGWATTDGPGAPGAPAAGYEYASCNTEANQSAFFTRAFEKVRAESPYVTHMIIWNLNFQQVVANTDEKWAFGILRSDLSPRPAYTAIKAMPKS